jgi:hypothetical protein
MNANAKEDENLRLTQTVSSEIPFPLKSPVTGQAAAPAIRTAHGGEHIVASAGEKVIAESDSCVVAREGSQVVALSGSKVIFTPGSEVTIHFGSEIINPFGARVKPRAPASKAARAAITGILDAYTPLSDEKLNANQAAANALEKKADDAAEIKRLLSELSSLIAQQQARQFGEISNIVRSLQTITISTGSPIKRAAPKTSRNVDRRKFLRGKRSS